MRKQEKISLKGALTLPMLNIEGRKRPKSINRTGRGGLGAKYEEITGVSRSDPNFEFAVRDAVANEEEEVAQGILLGLGFEKPEARSFRKMETTFIDHISRTMDKD